MDTFLCNHDMHTHTFLSACCHDERMTPENMLRYAQEQGYDLLCLTDHMWDSAVPGASEWYAPQDAAHVHRSLPLPDGGKTRFVFGCETEFCGGDKLGLSAAHFDDFGFIIIPPDHFHMVDFVRPASVDQPEAIARLLVERLEDIAKLPLPFQKIGIAHLTTSLINKGKSKYDVIAAIDIDRFSEAIRRLSRLGAGIELNGACFQPGWEEHADIELKLYRAAKAAGAKFYLGTDAHQYERLRRVQECLPQVVSALGLRGADRFILP